jgi:hypothetical protein
MKQVGIVTGNAWGFIYLGGIPYNPVKVKRFIGKGAGIRLGDLVIFEADDTKVLNYIKNAKYRDGSEIRMVKEFVSGNELAKAKLSQFSDVSDEIKKELMEEGVVITNDGIFSTPAENDLPDPEVTDLEIDIHPDVLALIAPADKRTLSILLQSSLKIATDLTDPNRPGHKRNILRDALYLAKWVDRNSTQILTSPYILNKIKELEDE